jgi:Domain of unknown function (DUF222)
MCSTLSEALDALATEDVTGLPGPAVLDRLRVLLPLANRLAAELARTVRRGEVTGAAEVDGAKTMAAWLRGHARLSPAAAGQLVRVGRTLEALPAVAAACSEGAVAADQVAVMAPVVAAENVAAGQEQGVDLAAVDATLAEVAGSRPYAELARVVQYYLDRLDPDGPEPDPTEQRSLTWAKHADGSLDGRFHLDAVGAEKVQAALEAHLQTDRPAGDPRTLAQRRADALVQLCDNLLASGTLPFLRSVKPQLLLTLGVGDLVDPGTGPAAAHAGFGAVLSAARARWAACDPDLTRIVLDPDGQPLDVGRTLRLVPPHLRKAVELRDRTCVFAGCDAPPWWCEVHHLTAWALGGETSLANSGLLCERHHTQVHHGFRLHRDTAGGWHTYRPDGTEIFIPARPLAPTG